LVENGWNRLCPPTGGADIAGAVLAAVGTSGTPAELYGDGNTAGRIAQVLTATR